MPARPAELSSPMRMATRSSPRKVPTVPAEALQNSHLASKYQLLGRDVPVYWIADTGFRIICYGQILLDYTMLDHDSEVLDTTRLLID